MTLLFTGIIQGFAKIELRQETSFYFYLKKYRALRPLNSMNSIIQMVILNAIQITLATLVFVANTAESA